MAKVLITDDKSKQVQHILEYRHNWKYVSNRAYAVNAVDKAISRGQNTIVLDKSKLKTKQYTSTEVFLYDREGNPLTIELDYVYGKNNQQFDLVPRIKRTHIVQGMSWPQHGDKFCKAEGRRQALISALWNLRISANDGNYRDLLDLKLFLQHFELRAKTKHPHWDWPNNLVLTWQYIDLWNALLQAKRFPNDPHNNMRTIVEHMAINLVSQANYDNLFNEYVSELLEFFCNGKEFNKKHKEETIEAAYYYYSKAIAQFYDDLSYASIQYATNDLTTNDLVEDLQDTLQG
jgi:hypothetical protein